LFVFGNYLQQIVQNVNVFVCLSGSRSRFAFPIWWSKPCLTVMWRRSFASPGDVLGILVVTHWWLVCFLDYFMIFFKVRCWGATIYVVRCSILGKTPLRRARVDMCCQCIDPEQPKKTRFLWEPKAPELQNGILRLATQYSILIVLLWIIG
jgi:hypothetical protein